MKIAVDIRTAGGEKAGKGNYTYNLVKCLLNLDHKNQYFLYASDKFPGFDHYKNANLKIIKGSLFHFKVAKDCKKEKIDFFFSPSSYLTPLLIQKPTKVFVTVHDLVAFLFPKNHNKKAIILERLLLKWTVKRADKILPVSTNTKNDLLRKFPKAKDKVQVIPCASEEIFQKAPAEDLKIFKQKTNLPEKFFLAVGTIQPRKNYLNFIRAFNRIHQKHPDIHLIIAGKEGWNFQEVYHEIAKHNLNKFIHVLGYLSDLSLRNLYSSAIALVFPSFYEGFGIPPLEAMSCQCPVICSNTSSLPEVVGNAALLVDPKKYGEIAAAMQKVLSKEIRDHLIRKGTIQARKFSWQKSAVDLLNLFNGLEFR